MNSRIIPITFFLILAFFSLATSAQDHALSDEVRSDHFSLSKNSLALNGYDPVAYFQEGPRKGSKARSYAYRGVTYHFANEENLAAFKASPEKYEPQYGGWCAWAMYRDGGRTESNPESYKIVDEKLYMFYDGFWGDTRKSWNEESKAKAEADLIHAAERYWTEQIK